MPSKLCIICGKEFYYQTALPGPMYCPADGDLEFKYPDIDHYKYWYGLSYDEELIALRTWLENDFPEICEEVRKSVQIQKADE